MQNEAWHCPAEIDMEFLGKVVILTAAYVSPKFQHKPPHQWYLHIYADLPACVIQPLQLFQNAAARLVFNLPKLSHVTHLLQSLHWLPVAARIRFKVLTLAYAAANKTAPHNLQDIVQAYTPARPLRSAATGRLAHPASHATVSRLSRLRSFSTLAPQWWNDLPIPIRTAPSLPIFCRSLKTHLFTLYLDLVS